MRGYKLVVMLKSDTKKEQKEKMIKDITKWSGEKTSVKTTEMGEKKLAYPIRGAKSADYVVFEITGEKIAPDVERRIVQQDDIIRHLMIRVD